MCSALINLLRPAPAKAPITDENEIDHQYRYWRLRVLYSSLIGYALFYFVRKNLSVAMPVMEHDLGLTKASLGLFLTLHGVLYGVSKFANGFWGDRANARYFMALGLLLSAVMNIFFGLSSASVALGIFWLLNGWFQGMGFPPCARLLTHWFSPSERGTKFSIWNTSHSIGAALAVVMCGFLVKYNWRLCMFVPAALAIACAFFLVNRLPDTPASLGLPPVEEYTREEEPEEDFSDGEDGMSFREFVLRYVFANPAIWVISVANFFLYTVRYSVLDWGPTFLTETRGVHLQMASWIVALYEISGVLGMLLGGWLTDKVFRGRAVRACTLSMVVCVGCLYGFWKLPAAPPLIYTLLLCGVGFSVYGPQCLVGVIAANLATRRAAATAIGLTGFFAYLSGILSGWGLGMIVDKGGWDPGFRMLVAAAAAAAVLFALVWNAHRGPSAAAVPAPSREMAGAGK